MITKIPNKDKILSYLKEAKKTNEGPWDQHSLNVGKAAKMIAIKCDDLDENVAYAMGALHDIGRREGFSHMHHIISGYQFMMKEGYEDIARICLTHSFPNNEFGEYFGEKDCSSHEIEFIKRFLKSTTYNDYDKLIQLCDVLSTTNGYCLMEKRMVDVALRYDVSKYTMKKWKRTFELKEYFEKKIGVSIYDLLPNVIENTFV